MVLITKFYHLSHSSQYTKSPFYYLWNIPLLIMPYSLFMIYGILKVRKIIFNKYIYFLTTYPLIIIVVLSVFNTKASYYSLQLFPLILTLQHHFKSADLYYQDSLGANYFSGKLKEYDIKIKNLGINLEHFGFRWWHLFKAKSEFLKLGIDKFDLIIDIQSKIRNTLILKRIPTLNFYSSTYGYFFCTTKKEYIHSNNVNEKTLLNLEKFFGTSIKKINYDLRTLNTSFIDEAKKLLPNNNYIGFSLTHANEKRIKHWPLNKFIDLANRVETKNKIPVFFVEKTNQEVINEIKSKVPKALFPEHQSSLASPALVTALASRLEMAISIDN